MPKSIRDACLLLVITSGLAAGCNGGRPDYSARSVAPEVSFADAPPAYTSTASLTLSVAARNPTGVKAVYALSGSQRWTAKPQPDGTWQATVQLPHRTAGRAWTRRTSSSRTCSTTRRRRR